MSVGGKDVEQPLDISRLLVLRKVTTAVSEHLGKRLRAYLAALSPLLQPGSVFGGHVRAGAGQSVKDADESLRQLRSIYESLAGAAPFNLPKVLEPPLDIFSVSPDITPFEYTYEAHHDGQSKQVTVTAPLRWVLTYRGFGPERLRQLLAGRERAGGGDLQQCVLHYLALRITLARRSGVTQLFEALRFALATDHMKEFGELPVTCVSCPIATTRAPDDVIIQTTEVSGKAAFEEILDVREVINLRDPLREQLLDLIRTHGDELLSEVAS